MARVWVARAVGAAVAGYSSVALACPVCFSAKDEAQRQAFFDTTIFLTLLPVAMIGGIAYWLFKRAERMAAEDATESRSRLVEAEGPAPSSQQPAEPVRAAASTR